MLSNEVADAKRAVNTDGLQISIGEITSMYQEQELNIMPEFQRLFRWSREKKTAFIESILIGIPVPPAFAYEKQDGTWELVDGLQRISTILEFMGVLRDPDDPDKILPSSTLTASTYLPSLEGVTWVERPGNDQPHILEKALQLFFRRSRLDFQVLKYPSDSKTKYDLFQRLNRGGEYANEQEVRTCSMVLANVELTNAIREIARTDSFSTIFRITEDQKKKQKDLEFAVRSIVHTAEDFDPRVDVQEFLDWGITAILASGDPDNVIARVRWTVDTLDRLFGEDALLPHDDAYEGMSNRFSLRALESLLVGIARNQVLIQALDEPDSFLQDRVYEFWKQQDVAELSASGLRGTTRIQRTVPFGEEWFKP